MRGTDVHIESASFNLEDIAYRTPIKFGGVVLDKATLLHADVTVRDKKGKVSLGRGSMPLGNVWSFPSKNLSYEQTLSAMKSLAGKTCDLYNHCNISGHPLDIGWQLEKEALKLAEVVTRESGLADPVPPLAVMVSASPFDAALHDAYGKLHGMSVYQTYTDAFVDTDLGRFLGKDFKGLPIHRHVRKDPVHRLPLYHLIGALDPLTKKDVEKPVGDGLPETLGDWIQFNGLTHLKIKLNGSDLDWDVDRVLRVESAAVLAQAKRGVVRWHYSLDFNEKCPNVEYLLEFLAKVKAASKEAFPRIAYIEQPTARDLKANRQNVMHKVSAQIPVVIDESLLDLESLLTARDMGYTGAALKACKGQTQSVILASAAKHLKMFLCVQDLTCPGASLIQSAGIAAHVHGVAAIEANSRQYCPKANEEWAPRFPGIFDISDGTMMTGCLTGPGLGAYPVEPAAKN
ncbi:MAG: hypothetical protein EXR99_14190 [Gemmataceae bacterium]|nr:hypothetical protein [Gemmataceae bacterium]